MATGSMTFQSDLSHTHNVVWDTILQIFNCFIMHFCTIDLSFSSLTPLLPRAILPSPQSTTDWTLSCYVTFLVSLFYMISILSKKLSFNFWSTTILELFHHSFIFFYIILTPSFMINFKKNLELFYHKRRDVNIIFLDNTTYTYYICFIFFFINLFFYCHKFHYLLF